jgi:hypothetical protein
VPQALVAHHLVDMKKNYKFSIFTVQKNKRGFTLLLAALTSSIVLALGASIFVIAKKQLTLSSLGRDSQYAFYSADQAAECALYWDMRGNYFATTTPLALLPPTDPTCDSQHWKDADTGVAAPGGVRIDPAPPAKYPYMFKYRYEPTSAGTSYCAKVYVKKCDGILGIWDSTANDATCASAGGAVHTTIHVDGYSTSCSTLTSNPRALQRSVELHY